MQFVFCELGIEFLYVIQMKFRLQGVNQKSSQEYERGIGGVAARCINLKVLVEVSAEPHP
jgi:hypothetical protein